MTQIALVARAAGLVVLVGSFSAPAAAQTGRFDPLADSVRLFGSPWHAETLVRVDTASGDSLALAGINAAFLIAPGKVVFLGRLARSRGLALMSWVHGRVRVLARHDEDLVLPDGSRFRPRLAPRGIEFWPGRPFLYLAVPGLAGRGMVYATDGERVVRVVGRDDSLTLRGRRNEVSGAEIIGLDAGSAIVLALVGGSSDAILRHTGDGLDPLVVQGDTIAPGTTLASLGAGGGFQHHAYFPDARTSFRSAPLGRWSIVVPGRTGGRRPEWYLMSADARGAARVVLATTDTVPADPGRDVNAIRAIPLGDGRFVVQTRHDGIVVGTRGDWRVVLHHRDSLPEPRGSFELLGAERLSDRAILLVLYILGGQVSVLVHDGTSLVPLGADSLAAARLEGLRRNLRGQANARNLARSAGLRPVPGYDGRLALRLPILIADDVPGLRGEAVVLVDVAALRLRAMPRLPVSGRDSISLGAIIGWTSDTEAVALLDSEIVVLRRN